MAITRLRRPDSLFEMALKGLRASIVDGTLELGEQVSELGISRRLGISKTPVREALQALRREGLVQIDPQRGTTVFRPDEADLQQIFDFRALLEVGAARRVFAGDRAPTAAALGEVVERMRRSIAAEDHAVYRRLDSAFHATIIAGARNTYISQAYQPLSSKVDALRSRGLADLGVVRRSMVFHERLLTLLTVGDGEGFCSALERHIANSSQDYRAWLRGRIEADALRQAAPGGAPR